MFRDTRRATAAPGGQIFLMIGQSTHAAAHNVFFCENERPIRQDQACNLTLAVKTAPTNGPSSIHENIHSCARTSREAFKGLMEHMT